MEKSKLPQELMEQLQMGVQSNLNQVDSDLRDWVRVFLVQVFRYLEGLIVLQALL